VSLPRALSKLGLCSRTQAFDFIEAGRVAVNGAVSKDASLRVSLEHDAISVDGKLARESREPVVIALHKPVGYVTTRVDPQGRPTVYELLPELDRFVFPVGRLDKDTSGLLILTDDHRLGETLTNPESHVPKTYEVVVDRLPDESAMEGLRRGLDIGKGERTRPALVSLVHGTPGEIRLRLSMQEGKNRQVRRMLAAVGLSVLGLTRTEVGGLKLAALPPGSHRLLTLAERRLLLECSRESEV
jgi:23S rRNA pseudouridine2605 synthase